MHLIMQGRIYENILERGKVFDVNILTTSNSVASQKFRGGGGGGTITTGKYIFPRSNSKISWTVNQKRSLVDVTQNSAPWLCPWITVKDFGEVLYPPNPLSNNAFVPTYVQVLSSMHWLLQGHIAATYFTFTDDDCLLDLVNIRAFFQYVKEVNVVYCGFLYEDNASPHRSNTSKW